MSARERRGGEGLRHSLTDATQRIEEIVDAAEKVAREIRSDAEEEASRYLEQRRADADALVRQRIVALEELSASLRDKAAGLQQRAAGIASEIDGVMARMQELSGGETAAVSAPEVVDAPEPAPAEPEEDAGEPPSSAEPVAYAGTAAQETAAEPEDEAEVVEGEDSGASEEALLRATQMAVAGSDREEIERTLATEFSVEDPSAIVDEILGSD